MTTKPKQPDDWFREMDAGLEDAPGALAVPGSGEYTYAVPPGMSEEDLVRHAELLLVEKWSREPSRRAGTVAELDVVQAALGAGPREVVLALDRDLAMLDGVDEPSGAPPVLGQALRTALVNGNAPMILHALRATPEGFPTGMRAEFRGRAWGKLGFVRAAVLFMEFAYETGEQPSQLAALLDTMRMAGQFVAAAERAEQALAGTPPPLVDLAAARAVFWGAHYLPKPRRPSHDQLLGALDVTLDRVRRAGLGTSSHPALVRSYTTTLALRAHVLDLLGRSDDAIATLDEGVQLDPGDMHLRVVRAVLRVHRDPASAQPDLEVIVDAGEPFVDAYVWLAQLYLESGAVAACTRVCERGLTWAHEPPVSAMLHELLAVSLGRQGRFEEAVSAIELAVGIAPNNRRREHNRVLLRQMRDSGTSAPLEGPGRGDLRRPELDASLLDAQAA